MILFFCSGNYIISSMSQVLILISNTCLSSFLVRFEVNIFFWSVASSSSAERPRAFLCLALFSYLHVKNEARMLVEN